MVEVDNPLPKPFVMPTFWVPNVILSSDYLITVAPLKVFKGRSSLSIMNMLTVLPSSKYSTNAPGGWESLYSLGIDSTIVQAGAYATGLRERVQIASRPQMTKNYGMAGAIAQGFVDNFSAVLAPGVAGDPQQVADLIGDLIARPAGQRPLYQNIGPHSEALAGINETHIGIQSQVLSEMGMGALLGR